MNGSSPKKPTNQGSKSRSGLRATHVIQGIIVLAIVGVLGSIGLSAMNDRAVKERDIQAFLTGESAARYSQNYYLKNGQWPTQTEFSSQPFVSSSTRSVSAMSIADNGMIKVVMTGHKELNGKLIQLTPTIMENGISWACATDYKERHFPEFLNKICNDKFPRE